MIRRKFMKFAPKEHSDEKVKKSLEKHNVPTFEGHQPAKFSQFGNMAKDLAAKSRKTFETPDGGHVAPAEKTFSWQQKAVYGGGTGARPGQADSRNPHAVVQPQGNPYASQNAQGANLYGSNPYGGAPMAASSSPYGDPGAAAGSHANPHGGNGSGYAGPAPNAAPNAGPGAGRGYDSGYDSYAGSQAGYDEFSGERGAERTDRVADRGGEQSAPFAGERSRGDAFGEPLARTRTNQSTTTTAARQELFGAAPRRANPKAAEFDELNRTQTELEDEDELLTGSANLERPQYATNRLGTMPAPPAAGQNGEYMGGSMGASMGGAAPAMPQVPEASEDPEDELNHLPSDFQHDELVSGGAGAGEDTFDGYNTAAAPNYGGNYGAAGYGASRTAGADGQQLFEDSEDEDVEYVKREIRQTKQESVESTRRALQIAAEAETSGRNAMGMLGDQGERLGNSATTVSLGHVQARVGERNAEELQRLNRSIFIPNVSNPFNSRRRNQLREQRLKSERRMDELEREELERQQRESEQRVADGLNSAGYGYSETAVRARQRMNRDNPERKMYQFEADSDDDALEDELDQNLDGISQAAKRLHGLSLKINDEVTDQNERIEQMGGRVDELDYSLHKSTAKMATIN